MVTDSKAHEMNFTKAYRDLAAQLAAVTQQRDAAVAALKAVEWVPVYQDKGHTWYGCPACHSDKEYGKHTADCSLATSLAKAKSQ